VLRRVGFGLIRFCRETTVKEFGVRKASAYGILRTLPQHLVIFALGLMGVVPWFRNKMVVMATKGSLL
jgi:hypothetical protein